MARRLGAAAVGTTVVPEVIAARHMDLQVMAVTLLTRQHLTGDSSTSSPENGPSLEAPRGRLHHLLTKVMARLDADRATT
jgi:purine-nucleoside phosphorylase